MKIYDFLFKTLNCVIQSQVILLILFNVFTIFLFLRRYKFSFPPAVNLSTFSLKNKQYWTFWYNPFMGRVQEKRSTPPTVRSDTWVIQLDSLLTFSRRLWFTQQMRYGPWMIGSMLILILVLSLYLKKKVIIASLILYSLFAVFACYEMCVNRVVFYRGQT